MPKHRTIKSQNSTLQPYIEGYVYSDLSNEPVLSKEFLPKTGMIWAFTNVPVSSEQNSKSNNFLLGIQDKPLPLKWESQGLGFFVKFSPYGMSRFVDIPIQRFSNKVVESSKVWEYDINNLHEQVINCKTIAEKITIVELFLIKRFTKPTSLESDIFQLADNLKKEESSVSVLKNKFPLSSRQLEIRFKSLIGVNMQTFKRICRFQHAFNLLYPNKTNLTNIGYEAGYYDQAHFSNDFKEFTKFRPKNFFRKAPFYKLLDKTTSIKTTL